jgi:primosomal protein N' (replication factor Y)
LPLYCDVSLPVPLDQAFTYLLPETLRHRVKAGCRLIVPFGRRKLTGIVLGCHDARPEIPTREALRLVDSEPVLDDELLTLARWISAYYCAPLGEVLRGMLPLAADIRRGKIYALTDAGRDAARQLLLDAAPEEAVASVLRKLEQRPLSAAHLLKVLPLADKTLKTLERRGFIVGEQVETERDPLRASSERLRVELTGAASPGRLKKAEREMIAFLELHPGSHNLKELESVLVNASAAARLLARKGVLKLQAEPVSILSGPVRAPHTMNRDQQQAFERIRDAILVNQFRTFLLQGVTGSGKTEVYLNAIETALASGRGALLLVPEIALTPAVAGQFFARFGDRVAILHSAFTDVERGEQWRRIRSGAAGVVVGTRSGVFAPVRDLGLIVVDEEHDQSYKQEETPRYNGRDVAIVRAQAAGACVILGSATPSLESRYNAERGKYELLELRYRIEERPMPRVEVIDMGPTMMILAVGHS